MTNIISEYISQRLAKRVPRAYLTTPNTSFPTTRWCSTLISRRLYKMCSTKHQNSPPAAVADKNEAGDWRQEAINGGSLKLVNLETGSNGWASPPGDLFSLRGRNYFTKKHKSPSGPWLLHPAGVDWLRSTSKLDHILSRSDNRVMQALRKQQSEGSNTAKKSFVLAVNLQIPGRDHHSAVFYFATDDPIPAGSLLYRFIHGDDSFRNQRFKIVNRIVKGPWIVKATVGNYSACLLGKALNCHYHSGPNYLEIDVDIGSSKVASAILRLALGCVTAVTIDMGFVVEAQEEEDLPERLFGAVRICQMEMSSATFVDSATNRSVNTSGVHGNRVQASDLHDEGANLD